MEVLGSYAAKQGDFKVKAERVKYWMSKGAKVSDTMHNFLISNKIIEGKKINILPKKSPPKKDLSAEASAQGGEAPVVATPVEVTPASA